MRARCKNMEVKFRTGTVVGKICTAIADGATDDEVVSTFGISHGRARSLRGYTLEHLASWNKGMSPSDITAAMVARRGNITLTPVAPKVAQQTIPEAAPEPITAPTYTDSSVEQMMKAYIPTQNGYIERNLGEGMTDVDVLGVSYKNKHNVLIVGDTGTGKTHLVRHFAHANKIPYARLNLNAGTTADELVGRWVPSQSGGFKWQDGILTTFVRHGGVVVLDEVNAASPDVLFCLHGLLDDERMLVLQAKDGEVVRAHPNLFIVATANLDYEGTRTMNEAFLNRFAVKLHFDYDTKVEKKLIKDEILRKVAKMVRDMKNQGKMMSSLSTRDLLNYQRNKELYNNKMAIEFLVVGRTASEQVALRNVFEAVARDASTEVKG